MIAPVTLGLGLFYFYPFFRVIRDSLHDIGSFDRDLGFVGIKNYATMMQDSEMWQSLGNTFKYVGIIVPLSLIFALLIAVLLNAKVKGLSFFRVVYFLPAVTMSVAVSMVWRWIFNGDFGILNGLMTTLGLDARQWLSDKSTAMLCISIVAVWTNVGYYMIILLAGIQGISRGYYEAAEIDGATPWQKFHKITLPLLTPTIFYVVIMLVISTFQIFSEIYMMIDFEALYQFSHALKGISEVAGYRDMWQHAARFVEGTRAKDIAICSDELEHISKLADALEE